MCDDRTPVESRRRVRIAFRALTLAIGLYVAASVVACAGAGGEPGWGVFSFRPFPWPCRPWPWVHPKFGEPPYYDPSK